MSPYHRRYCIWLAGRVVHYTDSFWEVLRALDAGLPVAEGVTGYSEDTGEYWVPVRELTRLRRPGTGIT